MRIVILILRMLLGLIFIGSAALKLFPIEAFELVLIKQVGFSWAAAPFFARLIILFEFALGIALVFGWKARLTIWASLAMLAFFTIYLGYQMVIGAGDENCGCFGELIPMDAPTSIAKNLILIAWSLVLLWQFHYHKNWKYSWINLILTFIAIPALFLALPLPEVDLNKDATIGNELIEILDSDLEWDLKQDDKLIVVMMAKCVHCKQLASLLSTLEPTKAQSTLRIIVYGSDESIQEFVSETGIESFQVKRSANRNLLQAINGTFPTAMLVKEGDIVSNWTGSELNINLLSKVLQNKE